MNSINNINSNSEQAIPKHWQLKKLGEVCNIFPGYGFPKNLQGSKSGKFPFYKVGDISNNVKVGNRQLEICNNYIDEKILLKLKASPYPKNTIVFAKIGEGLKLNRRAIIKTPGIVDNNAIGLKAIEKICDDLFLFFFLTTVKLEDYSKATTVPSVRKSEIEEIEIPLPPLPEQLAIVSKIEELFSELDKGVESLKTAQQQLKVYRQSLLKWAFEGRLTSAYFDKAQHEPLSGRPRLLSEAETSGNIAAEEKEKYGNNELPKGWKWMKLDSVCTKIQDGSHFSPQVQYDEPGVDRFMYITAKNIRNDHMDFRKLSYVDRDFHESIFGRCNPEFGDVLLTKDGINTGEVTLNTLHEPFSLLSSVCIFKTKKEQLISPFLKYFIQSPFGNKAILNSMTGTAIKRIILRKIKDALIALPPLKEQQRIVDELESRLTVCDKIEKTINEGLQQSEALRQSILKRAFEGRLV